MNALNRGKFIDVDGVRTHYFDEGSSDNTIVLLHGGEFGAAAEFSWEYNIPYLSQYFRVVAPDWLGFGLTDKIHDFQSGRVRRIRHMQRFLEVMCIGRAHFMGNSMGGGLLARVAATSDPMFHIDRMVLVSGGGFSPYNEHREALLSYDGTVEGMRALLRAAMHDDKWANNDEYVRRRVEMSLLPGAWECCAAARLRPPLEPPRREFGLPDTIPYEDIRAPTLIIAGANDKLRKPGYAHELGRRIPNSEVAVLDACGHCANIEKADVVNTLVESFLLRTPIDVKGEIRTSSGQHTAPKLTRCF